MSIKGTTGITGGLSPCDTFDTCGTRDTLRSNERREYRADRRSVSRLVKSTKPHTENIECFGKAFQGFGMSFWLVSSVHMECFHKIGYLAVLG